MKVLLTNGSPHQKGCTYTALKNSGKFVPWQVVTISTDGRILDR